MIDYMSDVDRPSDDPLLDHARIFRNAAQWLTDRLVERGFASDGLFLILYSCTCHQVSIRPNQRATGVKPSPELIAALREIAPLGFMKLAEDDHCPGCGEKIPDTTGSIFVSEFDSAGVERGVEIRKMQS
jgi:hypothetical protein